MESKTAEKVIEGKGAAQEASATKTEFARRIIRTYSPYANNWERGLYNRGRYSGRDATEDKADWAERLVSELGNGVRQSWARIERSSIVFEERFFDEREGKGVGVAGKLQLELRLEKVPETIKTAMTAQRVIDYLEFIRWKEFTRDKLEEILNGGDIGYPFLVPKTEVLETLSHGDPKTRGGFLVRHDKAFYDESGDTARAGVWDRAYERTELKERSITNAFDRVKDAILWYEGAVSAFTANNKEVSDSREEYYERFGRFGRK